MATRKKKTAASTAQGQLVAVSGITPAIAPQAPVVPLFLQALDAPLLQGGVRCALGPKTLIVGRNGTGKSTVLRAASLVLKSTALDVHGRRALSAGREVMSLHQRGEGELYVRALLSDGGQASYKVSGDTGSAKAAIVERPANVEPKTALPLFEIHEALTEGSADTVRKFLLRHICGNVSLKDIVERLPKVLQTTGKRLLDSIIKEQKVDALDGLVALTDSAKKKAADMKKQANAMRTPADGAPQLEPCPTDEDIKEAEAALAAARAGLEAASAAQARVQEEQRRAAMVASRGPLMEQKVAAEAQVAAYAKAVEGFETERNELLAQPGIPVQFEWARDLLNEMVPAAAAGASECWLCGNAPEHAVLHERLQKILDLFESQRTKRERIGALGVAIQEHLRAGSGWEQSIRNIDSQIQAIDALTTVSAAEAPADVPTLEDARKELDEAQLDLNELKQLVAQWAHVRGNKDRADQLELEGDNWAKVGTAANRVREELLDGAKSAFEARVQKYLPPTDRFALDLADGRVRYGFLRRTAVTDATGAAAEINLLHTVLSGAEWARVQIAFASACTEGEDPSKLRVLIPVEDRAFDAETLAEALDALAAVPFQVLIASPIAPARRDAGGILRPYSPAGWTTINTDAGQQRSAAPPAEVTA